MVLVLKNLPASTGNVRDMGLIPGSGDPLEEGMTIHSSILAWKSPWTVEPGGLQVHGGPKELDMTKQLSLLCH